MTEIEQEEFDLINATVEVSFDLVDEDVPDQAPVPEVTDDDDLADEAEDVILESEDVV